MPSLSHVFLRDLQFNDLVRFLERAEQRRRRLANLIVDRSILDLDEDVVVELAVEILEVVVGGAGAVILEIPPVHLVVVYKPAIEKESAMRLKRATQSHLRRRRECGPRRKDQHVLRNPLSGRSHRGQERRV